MFWLICFSVRLVIICFASSPDIVDRRSEIMWPVGKRTVEAILHTMPPSVRLMNTTASLVIA